MPDPKKTILRLILIAIAAVALGTAGYMVIEKWSFGDSLYMTAITLTTVGFGEVNKLTPAGRLFTVLLIFIGGGLFLYFLSRMAEYIVSMNMELEWNKMRSINMVKKMKGQVIICGYGQVGKSAAAPLKDSGEEIVVVDINPERVNAAIVDDLAAIEGDATDDEVLKLAGIENAAYIIVSTGDDSLNLFIVLSARALNPDLLIIARANISANSEKLLRAGADRTVSPYEIGGQHMGNIVIRPHVTDFFDYFTFPGGQEIWIEEQILEPDCSLIGKTVVESELRRRTGVTLVAIYRAQNGTNIIPDADTIFEEGDKIIILGSRGQLAELENLTLTLV